MDEDRPRIVQELQRLFAQATTQVLEAVLGIARLLTSATKVPDHGAGPNETDLLIAEFNALRSEILDNFATARAVLALYLTAVAAIAASAVSGRFDRNIVAIIPLVSAVFWWVHLDTRMIVAMIGGYIARVLSERARELGSTWIFRWEEIIRLPLRKVPLGYWPWKFGMGIDGTAWPLYFLPSVISILLTMPGAVSDLVLYTDPVTMHPGILFPVWLWWVSGVLTLFVAARAYFTERDWWKALEYVPPRSGV